MGFWLGRDLRPPASLDNGCNCSWLLASYSFITRARMILLCSVTRQWSPGERWAPAMSLWVSEWFIVEKEFEVEKNQLRKKFGWVTYAFKVVIATILLLLYNTICVYRPPHHDHHAPQHLGLCPGAHDLRCPQHILAAEPSQFGCWSNRLEPFLKSGSQAVSRLSCVAQPATVLQTSNTLQVSSDIFMYVLYGI
jgi:hypothetical protein